MNALVVTGYRLAPSVHLACVRRIQPTENAGCPDPCLALSLRAGPYLLSPPVAKGRTGIVHAGMDTGAETKEPEILCVKRIHSWLLADNTAIEDLRRRVRGAIGSSHRHLVATRGVEVHDREVLVISEYVEGAPLDFLLSQCRRLGRAMPLAILGRIIMDAVAAYDARRSVEAIAEDMPERALRARSITPANLLVGTDGITRLLGPTLSAAPPPGQPSATAIAWELCPPTAPEIEVRCLGFLLFEMLTAGIDDHEPLSSPEPHQGGMTHDVGRAPSIVLDILRLCLDPGLPRAFASPHDVGQALLMGIVPAGRQQVGRWVMEVAREFLWERSLAVESLRNGAASVLLRLRDPNYGS